MTHRKFQHKKRFKPKTFNRKYKGKKYGTAVSRPLGGAYGAFLPQRITTKLKYSDTFQISAISGNMDDYQFRLNSIFDPDRTGTGHQQMGRDQLAALYNRYRVDKAMVVVEFNKTSENAVAGIALLANNSDTSLTNPFSAVTEQPWQKNATLSFSTAGSQTKKVLRMMCDLAKITGVSHTKYKSDDEYSALVSGNPGEIINLHIICTDVLASTTTTVSLSIKLVYYVEFFDPIVISQS